MITMPKLARLIPLLWLVVSAILYTISHYPVDTLTFHQTLRIGRGNIHALAWSPDAETLAVDTITGTWLYTAALEDKAHLPEFRHAAFNPDGRWLAGVFKGNQIGVVIADTLVSYAVLQGHEAEIVRISWSSANTLASIDENGGLRVWNVGAQRTIFRGQGPNEPIALFWNEEETYLAAKGFDGTFVVWDLLNGRVSLDVSEPLPYHPEMYYHLIWLDAEHIARYDSATEVWDAVTGRLTTTRPDVDYSGIRSRAFAGYPYRLSASEYEHGAAYIYIKDRDTDEVLQIYPVSSASTWKIAWQTDHNLVARSSQDGEIRVWNVAEERLVGQTSQHMLVDWTVALRDDGRVAATGNMSNDIHLWDTQSGAHLGTMQGDDQNTLFQWQPGGTLLATLNERSSDQVLIWETDPLSAEPLVTLVSRPGVRVLAWSDDGSKLAFSSRNVILIWDTRQQQIVQQIVASPIGFLDQLLWDHQGNLLAALGHGQGYGFYVFDTATGLRVPMHEVDYQNAAAWTPMDDLLFAAWAPGGCLGDDPAPHLGVNYSLSANMTGVQPTLTSTFPRFEHRIWSADFAPDASHIAITDNHGNLAIVDVQSGRRYPRHSRALQVQWEHNGYLLALRAGIDEFEVVDMLTMQTLLRYDVPIEIGGATMSFSDDSQRFAIAVDGTLVIWEADVHCRTPRFLGEARWCE